MKITKKQLKTTTMTAVMTLGLCMVTYAMPTEEGIKNSFKTIIDSIFIFISMGLGVMGSFSLIPGLIKFIKATVNHENEDRSNAARQLIIGIVVVVMTVGVFISKTLLFSMIGI